MAIKKFKSFSYQSKTYNNIHPSRKRNVFNDLRSIRVMDNMVEQMCCTSRIAVQQLAQKPSESKRFYRFLNNDKIEIEEVIKMNCVVKPESIKGESLLLIGDTVSFNMSKTGIKKSRELGVLNDGKTPGFRTHAHLALNEKGEVLGLADMIHWIRPKKSKKEKEKEKGDKKSWDEKESYRWVMGAKNASELTKSASQRTFLFDQEADNFALMEHITEELEDDFIIRANHKRTVLWEGQKLTVDQCLAQNKSLGSYKLKLPSLNHYSWTLGRQVRRKTREAKVELKVAKVKLFKPKKGNTAILPKPIYLVEAREIASNLPKGESPVLWRIWTTRPVSTFEEAKQVVYYYTLRWVIEQYFRTLKKKGFQVEMTELKTFKRVLKQITMAMNAAAKVIQLVYARNRIDSQPTDDVFSKKEQQVLQKVKERLEGKTEKQKNPFPPEKLSWAAWIIGRLGGWKGYASQKPPGPITMKRGLEKFYIYMEAIAIVDG